MDVGAGDGAYVLYRARREPDTFAIAIDASPDGLACGAWRAKRAGLSNIAFLVEGVERLPPRLSQIANEVTVHFPWGSLLRGLVDASPGIVGPIADLLKPGAELRVLVSAVDRDGVGEATRRFPPRRPRALLAARSPALPPDSRLAPSRSCVRRW